MGGMYIIDHTVWPSNVVPVEIFRRPHTGLYCCSAGGLWGVSGRFLLGQHCWATQYLIIYQFGPCEGYPR